MNNYEGYRRRSPLASLLGPLFLILLVVLAVVAWRITMRGGLWGARAAPPREITPRGNLAEDEQATIDLYKKTRESVVHVTNIAEVSDFFSFNVQRVQKGTGSGMIWDDAGHVVTNYHVVKDAAAVQVVLADRSTYETQEIWVYPDKDLAVLRIDAPQSKLHPITIGTSKDLQVGQKAFAIGNPFGLDWTLSPGVVSALGREIESVTGRPIPGVIQTTAPINPGNSGGPLLDSYGRLIGVTTAILSPSGAFAGIGFAIPVDEVYQIVTRVINRMQKSNRSQGSVAAPGLGIDPASDQLAQELGVEEGILIVRVLPNSPAAKAGLRPTRLVSRTRVRLGDIIVAIDGKPVKTVKDYYSILADHQAGDTVKLTILRNEEKLEVNVKMTE